MPMLTLLQSIQQISSSKDRIEIIKNFILSVSNFSEASNVSLYKITDIKELKILKIAESNNSEINVFKIGSSSSKKVSLSQNILDIVLDKKEVSCCVLEENNSNCYVLPFKSKATVHEKYFLLIQSQKYIDLESQKALICFFEYFINHISLLDYSECDSLTGLLNRKTFDETFEHILNAESKAKTAIVNISNGENRRESEQLEENYWLAEIDIDKFKNINDTFGHLFGDEVLIRVANLMRDSLREYDKLFRFGGEEFIIIFNTPNRTVASNLLNRLIKLIENHEFPQVGKVTCSIGFTKIDSFIPVDILGRADKALYYAKKNGRNQVCCYEDLIEKGLLKESTMQLNAQDDVDIFFTN